MPGSTGVGISIDERQIHVAKLRRTARGIHLQGLGSAPTPEGAMRGDIVVEQRLLGAAVRAALRMAGLRGASAVVGLPSRASASRVLELPSMEREEMRQVVAGEMEHYRIIPLDQGTFDFVPLGEPSETSRRVRALVMAAEKRAVDGCREGLRYAGVAMTALEPTALAACRSISPALARGDVAVLTLGGRGCEFAVFNDGRLRYLRQLDVGAKDLVGGPESADAAHGPAEEQQALVLTASERPADSLQNLAFEMKRSIDFYHRETSEASRVEHVIVCADTELTPDLATRLEEALGLPVSVADPLKGIDSRGEELDQAAVQRAAPALAPAIGLALRALGERSEAPAMDLSLTGPESRMAKIAPRWLSRAMAFSAVAILAVIGTTLAVNHSLRARARELDKAKANLLEVTQLEQQRTEELRRVQEAQRIVQVKGLPWSEILFQVSGSTPPGVWLTEVRLGDGNMLSLTGVALETDLVAGLMESLTLSPLFSAPQMDSIQRETFSQGGLVRYEVRALVSPPPPSQPQAVEAKTTPGTQAKAPAAEGGTL